ncbi:MAG: HNH endonuclease [Deferribacteres bacterium]|nr:HNH endonuclease [Deferribacteres bacterium]
MKNMRDNWIPGSIEEYREYLLNLHRERKETKTRNRTVERRRKSLTLKGRRQILDKTGSKCHICGGEIHGHWQADHVLAHSGGGVHSTDNYLAAHPMCNNYRWDYIAEEFQEILRLGVWLRTQIERATQVGRFAADEFIKHEKRRLARRKQE